MIPHSFISGTFYSSSGVVRANEQITFMPLSTPFAVDGEIVLSTPQIVTLNGSGVLDNYRLAQGYYRVVVSDTDAFFINVPGDEGSYNIDSLASQLGSAPEGLQRILASRDIMAATQDSTSVGRSMRGVSAVATRILFLGETGDLSADTLMPDFGSRLGAEYVACLGNANPGGDPLYFESRIYQLYSDWMSVNFLYCPASEDWEYDGDVNAVMDYVRGSTDRYYKQVITVSPSCSIAVFVISSDILEPDGNTSTSVQATWLQTQLANSTERWKIVMFRDTPFTSVLGAGKAALDWPFGAWGANAVIAAGPKVMERLTIDSGIPLYVVGCSGTGTKDTFGALLPNSVYQITNVRAALVLTVTEQSLVFHIVSCTNGSIYNSLTIQSVEDRKLSFSILTEETGGLRVGGFGTALELDPYGLAYNSTLFATPIQRILEPTVGGIYRMDDVPTASLAAANPWLKNCLIAVGDDPVRFYWWNKADGDFEVARFDPYTGTSIHSGTRTQLTTPSMTPGPNGSACFGTVLDHSDQTVEMWVSINGGAFQQWVDWPTKKLYMFPQPVLGRTNYLAVFARKSGYLDSDIWGGPFLTS